jgi:hypothetical protein
MADEKLREDLTKGNWNTAGDFVKQKILKYLVEIDYFYNLAIFGTNDIYGDTFMTNENLRNTARLNSVKRLIHTIITLLRNTKFAIIPTDQPSFEEYIDRLLVIVNKLHWIKSEIKSGGKLKILIDENLFDKVINEIMHKMMDEVNFKLNKAGLIFTQKEEYDVKEQMKKFKQRIENI